MRLLALFGALALVATLFVAPAFALDGQPALEPFCWMTVAFDHIAAVFRAIFGGHVSIGALIGVTPAFAQEAADAAAPPARPGGRRCGRWWRRRWRSPAPRRR
ncbi:hypothetical protein HUN39_04710 [Methylocystis sp. FS]|uniref:hypothetical protein n=1 Tax=Methylocystis silviterrae TaxID=2743612 RepID=UPI001583A7D3|nr:hypothetical protein [Methylocystis silviterrae]NUJ79340.1 hypothetical protein [Methylocystis silviterrae]